MQAAALSFPNYLKFAVETLISSALALAEYEARVEKAAREGRDSRRLHLLDDGAMLDLDFGASCDDDDLRAELEIDEVSSCEEEDAIADALLRLAGEPLPPPRLRPRSGPVPRWHPAGLRRNEEPNVRSLDYLVRVFREEAEDEEALRTLFASDGDA